MVEFESGVAAGLERVIPPRASGPVIMIQPCLRGMDMVFILPAL